MTYQIKPLTKEITRIALEAPPCAPPPFDLNALVYLISGEDGLTLVNCGHHRAREALLLALRSLGHQASDIGHIVLMGAWPDLYGNLSAFPEARVSAFASPEDFVRARNQRLEGFNEAVDYLTVAKEETLPALGDAKPKEDFERWYTPLEAPSIWTLVSPGATLSLGDREALVLPARGTIPCAMALSLREDQRLFCGDLFLTDFLPWVREPAGLMLDSEQAAAQEPAHLHPNHQGRTPRSTQENPPKDVTGSKVDAAQPTQTKRRVVRRGAAQIRETGTRTTSDAFAGDGLPAFPQIRRFRLFLANFLSNAPQAITAPTTSAEIVANDLSLPTRLSVHFVAATLGYHQMFTEAYDDSEHTRLPLSHRFEP